jgi:hypothetical protein
MDKCNMCFDICNLCCPNCNMYLHRCMLCFHTCMLLFDNLPIRCNGNDAGMAEYHNRFPRSGPVHRYPSVFSIPSCPCSSQNSSETMFPSLSLSTMICRGDGIRQC